jgi:hypothetical protein
MMRLRRASALVMLYVLASAMTACAECAWVLFCGRSVRQPHSIPTEPTNNKEGVLVGGLSFPHLVLQSVGTSRARSTNSQTTNQTAGNHSAAPSTTNRPQVGASASASRFAIHAASYRPRAKNVT